MINSLLSSLGRALWDSIEPRDQVLCKLWKVSPGQGIKLGSRQQHAGNAPAPGLFKGHPESWEDAWIGNSPQKWPIGTVPGGLSSWSSHQNVKDSFPVTLPPSSTGAVFIYMVSLPLENRMWPEDSSSGLEPADKGSPSAGGSKNLRNRNQEQEAGGEPARPVRGFLCQRFSRADKAGGREGNSHLPFKTHLAYKITQIWGNFYLLPWTGFLFYCWLVKRGEVNQKDPEKEVQVPAMSFLVCTWQGHLPLPPGALVNLELPFVEYLLCIRHDTAFSFSFFAVPGGMWDFRSPTRGTNLCPLHWKCGFLTTGPPGKSQHCCILYSNTFYILFQCNSQNYTKR